MVSDLISITLLFVLPTLVTLTFVLIRRRALTHRLKFIVLSLASLNALHFMLPHLLGKLGISIRPFFPTPDPASQNAWAWVVFSVLTSIYVLCLWGLSRVPVFRSEGNRSRL